MNKQLMDYSDDEVLQQIEKYQIPVQMRKNYTVVPKEKTFKSSMWTNGVVLQAKGVPEYTWVCLRSPKCQEKGVHVLLGKNKSSSNAVKHLREQHNVESERSKTMSASKKTRQARLDDFAQVCVEATTVNSIDDDYKSSIYREKKAYAIELVVTLFIVRCFLSHSLVESEGFRFFVNFACIAAFNQKMHARIVTHRIVELYASLKNALIQKIKTDLKNVKYPSIHLLIDEWHCKLLRRRFIGVRVRYITEDFELVTMLLSVRFYDKSRVEEDIGKASAVLQHWVRGVLREYELHEDLVFAATSDAGSDVRYLLSKRLNLRWEWCCAHCDTHLISNAIKEACGKLKSQRKEKIPEVSCAYANFFL